MSTWICQLRQMFSRRFTASTSLQVVLHKRCTSIRCFRDFTASQVSHRRRRWSIRPQPALGRGCMTLYGIYGCVFPLFRFRHAGGRKDWRNSPPGATRIAHRENDIALSGCPCKRPQRSLKRLTCSDVPMGQYLDRSPVHCLGDLNY